MFFKIIYWITLILLSADTIDTIYRFVIIGYLGEGTTFPGVENIIKPTTADLIIFAIIQIGIIYGIYLLYNLKKVGGYLFLSSNIVFLIYASIFGPIAEIGISNIIIPIILFFCLYIILTIGIPWYYSDKFK
tara:strand:+ start:1304 stop:1699 length:396 start_codon:yes stop_codon:yes gene_type:complete